MRIRIFSVCPRGRDSQSGKSMSRTQSLIVLALATGLGGVLVSGVPGCQKDEGPILVVEADSSVDMNEVVLTSGDAASDAPLGDATAEADAGVSADAGADDDRPALDAEDRDADGGDADVDTPIAADVPADL